MNEWIHSLRGVCRLLWRGTETCTVQEKDLSTRFLVTLRLSHGSSGTLTSAAKFSFHASPTCPGSCLSQLSPVLTLLDNRVRAQLSEKTPGQRVHFLICKMGIMDNEHAPAHLPGYPSLPRQWSVVVNERGFRADRTRFKPQFCHFFLSPLLFFQGSDLNLPSPSLLTQAVKANGARKG